MSKHDQVQANNERLEYLGDAVLETMVSDILYMRYPDYDEGQLSILRSTLV
ncbi:ribonuclease III, partial [Bacillus sp. OG2]